MRTLSSRQVGAVPAAICHSAALKSALLGTLALIAASLALTTPAYAACTPPVFGVDSDGEIIIIDPIDPGDTITCMGIITEGVSTSVSNLVINVDEGASVTGSFRAIDLLGDSYTINNLGSLTGINSSGINFNGSNVTLNNSGTIGSNSFHGVQFLGVTGGTPTVINNVGAVISGSMTAIWVDTTGINIQNFGTISGGSGPSDEGIRLFDDLDGVMIVNELGGLITGGGDAILALGSDNVMVENHGTITGGDEGIDLFNGTNLTVNNDGTITGADRGIKLDGVNLIVNNHGSITGQGTTNVGDGIGITGISATINNWGTIRGNGQDGLNFGDEATNSTDLLYSVVNNVGGLISGLESGIRMNAPGTVINHGTISGDDTGITFRKVLAGSVDNFGAITAPRTGINLDRSQNVTITNHLGATISVGDQGAAVLMGSNDDAEFQSDNLTFINNGLVESLADGVTIKSPNSSVNNSGTIAAEATGISGESTSTNTSVSNSGTIAGVSFGVNLLGEDSFLINDGSITAINRGVGLGGNGTTIRNFGTITGTTGILIQNDATDLTIINFSDSTIEGVDFSILGGAGVENVTNQGSLIGNVDLGAGDDSFTQDFTTGSVSGTVDAGDGTDTFGILGAGTFAFPDFALNFEAMSVGSDVTFNFNGDANSFFDASMAVINEGTINAQSGNLNFLAPFELKGGTLSAAFDARLTLGNAITVSGNSTLQGEGTILLSRPVIVSDGAILTNQMSDLGGGAVLAGGNLITGTGSLSNAGRLTFRGGTINLNLMINQENGRFIFENDPDDAEATRSIDTRFRNDGIVEQNATATFGEFSIVSNQGSWTLDAGADIERSTFDVNPSFFNKAGADLIKNGAGGSRIDVFFKNDGNIAVNDGTLVFANGGLFNRDNLRTEITLSGGSELVFEAIDDLTGFEFRETTVIRNGIGGGSLIIDAPLLGAQGFTTAFDIQVDTNWLSGDIDFLFSDINFGPPSGGTEVTWRITGGQRDLDGAVTVLAGGTVEQEAGLNIFSERGFVVQGIWSLGANIIAPALDLGGPDLEKTPFTLDGGTLLSKAGMDLILDADVFVDQGSTVSVGAEGTLSIPTLTSSTFDRADEALVSGLWILGQSATIVLDDNEQQISKLKSGVLVEMFANSFLNNFPFVRSDFVVEQGAELRLHDIDFTVSLTYTNDGTLLLDSGSLDIQKLLQNGALSGNGTINGEVVNSFLIAPGFSPGTLTINGDYTQTSTGILEIEIGGTTAGLEYDQLIVNGTSTFEPGASIDITLLDLDGELFTPRTGDVFDFLITDDIVLEEGIALEDLLNFTNLPSGLRFDSSLVTLDGLSIFQLFAIFGIDADLLTGLSPQAQSVGDYVNDVLFNSLGSAATDDALADIAGLSDAGIISALSDLRPEPYGALSLGVVSQVSAVTDLYGARVARWRNEVDERAPSVWASGIAAFPEWDADSSSGTSAVDGDTYGLVIGTDFSFGNGVLAGVMLGKADLDQDFSSINANNDADNVFVGAYAAFNLGQIDIGAMGYYAFGEAETRRTIGATGDRFKGEGDLDHLVLHGEATYEVALSDYWTFLPTAELTYLNVDREGVTETGSDGLALDIAGGDSEFLFIDATARFAGMIRRDGGTLLVPEFRVGYRYELLDDDNTVEARFVGAAGNPFSVSGGSLERGHTIVGAKLTGHFADRLDAFIAYDGEIGSDTDDHRITAGIQKTF